MPRITAMPSEEIIGNLKGVLDFAYWRGIPYVRTWPKTPMAHRTPASLASAALFGEIAQGWALTGPEPRAAYEEAAADQPLTARDVYIRAVLGRLHERS